VTGVDPRAWRFAREPLGRLALAAGQAGPAFNLTHTRGLAACAISWLPGIGVDAEFGRDGAAPLDIAPYVFTAAEQARLARLEGAARSAAFFDTWTLKEAVMKATGRGFDLPPATLESSLAPPWVAGAITGDWGFALLRPTAAHHLAVAQQGSGAARLRWRHLEGAWQDLPLNRRPAT
jgi:4'-phosphopantetheinyl transferase